YFVHRPPGERKSGMPHSVEMPAPVNGTMTLAASTMSCSRAIPDSLLEAIISSNLADTSWSGPINPQVCPSAVGDGALRLWYPALLSSTGLEDMARVTLAAAPARRFNTSLPFTTKRFTMRYLHTMLRVRNLDASLRFFCDQLGLVEIRRSPSEKGR